MAIESLHKPAPRWFRITKRVLNNTINFVMALLLLMGYGAESFTLLVIKLSQSFIMEQLDTFMSNGEVYAVANTVTVSTEQSVRCKSLSRDPPESNTPSRRAA